MESITRQVYNGPQVVKFIAAIRKRHVYNGHRTSNLSQQQIKKFWSKMIFEQQNQKKYPEIFFQKKIWKNKIWEIFFVEKID